MLHRLLPLAAAVVSVALVAPVARAQEQPDLSTVLATVNGTDITLGHVAVAKQSLPDQYRNLPATVLFPGILDQLIQQTALAQSHEGERPARVTLALENEGRSLMAGEVVEQIMADAVTQERVEAMYREEYADEQGQEYNAAHILVETEKRAAEIRSELEGGADFAQMARDNSTGPSATRGGDLGWFGTGAMVPAFEQAVLALQPGEVSQPLQTEFGWHVIKLNEIRQTDAPELEEVQGEIEQKIRMQAVEQRIEDLTQSAEIDRSVGDGFDPFVLDQIDLSVTE